MVRLPLLAAGLLLLAAGCAAPPESVPEDPAPAAPVASAPAAMNIVRVTPSKDYPIDFCLVTMEPLNADGHPVAVTCDGVEVQFCCGDCVRRFKADPEKYLAVLREAREAKAGR